MEWWGTVLCSIGGALIGGFITWLINRSNRNYQDKKERKEELKKQFEIRPRLELKQFKGISESNIDSKADFECLLLNFKDKKPTDSSFFFVYDNKALNKKNLCCVEYEFINTGKTEIDSVCIISNQPKTTSIMELEERGFIVNNGLLSYEAWSKKRFIKPGETISIKVCYIKKQVMFSPISAIAAIYMEDINSNLWYQPLFCPTDEMGNSNRASRKEFNNNRDVRLALECFKDPTKW